MLIKNNKQEILSFVYEKEEIKEILFNFAKKNGFLKDRLGLNEYDGKISIDYMGEEIVGRITVHVERRFDDEKEEIIFG